jgi:hypothetical protein
MRDHQHLLGSFATIGLLLNLCRQSQLCLQEIRTHLPKSYTLLTNVKAGLNNIDESSAGCSNKGGVSANRNSESSLTSHKSKKILGES